MKILQVISEKRKRVKLWSEVRIPHINSKEIAVIEGNSIGEAITWHEQEYGHKFEATSPYTWRFFLFGQEDNYCRQCGRWVYSECVPFPKD